METRHVSISSVNPSLSCESPRRPTSHSHIRNGKNESMKCMVFAPKASFLLAMENKTSAASRIPPPSHRKMSSAFFIFKSISNTHSISSFVFSSISMPKSRSSALSVPRSASASKSTNGLFSWDMPLSMLEKKHRKLLNTVNEKYSKYVNPSQLEEIRGEADVYIRDKESRPILIQRLVHVWIQRSDLSSKACSLLSGILAQNKALFSVIFERMKAVYLKTELSPKEAEARKEELFSILAHSQESKNTLIEIYRNFVKCVLERTKKNGKLDLAETERTVEILFFLLTKHPAHKAKIDLFFAVSHLLFFLLELHEVRGSLLLSLRLCKMLEEISVTRRRFLPVGRVYLRLLETLESKKKPSAHVKKALKTLLEVVKRHLDAMAESDAFPEYSEMFCVKLMRLLKKEKSVFVVEKPAIISLIKNARMQAASIKTRR
eukprot:GHVN01003761.1.p1 GENE.GHVN01003761.1~~GHVN01003761.1.p1  ORF type:complete len:434 (-),score=50.42 GHVN01003761.1:590-1891(-)